MALMENLEAAILIVTVYKLVRKMRHEQTLAWKAYAVGKAAWTAAIGRQSDRRDDVRDRGRLGNASASRLCLAGVFWRCKGDYWLAVRGGGTGMCRSAGGAGRDGVADNDGRDLIRDSAGPLRNSARVGESDRERLKRRRVARIEHSASGDGRRGDRADGDSAVNDRGENARDVGTIGDISSALSDGLDAGRVDNRWAVGDDLVDDHDGIIAGWKKFALTSESGGNGGGQTSSGGGDNVLELHCELAVLQCPGIAMSGLAVALSLSRSLSLWVVIGFASGVGTREEKRKLAQERRRRAVVF